MGTGDTVVVFDEHVLGEEGYVSPPPPVFDGPGGLPTGWTSLTVPSGGKQYKGYMSDYAAVMPRAGGKWGICPVRGGTVIMSQMQEVWLDDMVAAIVMAEFTWPRK